jgi:hypothetical protein
MGEAREIQAVFIIARSITRRWIIPDVSRTRLRLSRSGRVTSPLHYDRRPGHTISKRSHLRRQERIPFSSLQCARPK